MKYCISCFKKIPLLASKCPHCIEKNQTVWGRLFLVLFLIISVVVAAKCYNTYKKGEEEHKELIELLDDVGVK